MRAAAALWALALVVGFAPGAAGQDARSYAVYIVAPDANNVAQIFRVLYFEGQPQTPEQITHSGEVLSFEPDENDDGELVFTRRDRITGASTVWLIDTEGEQRQLAEGSLPSWDGTTHVVYVDPQGEVRRLDLATDQDEPVGAPGPLLGLSAAPGLDAVLGVRELPDGSTQLFLQPFAGGDAQVLHTSPNALLDPLFSPGRGAFLFGCSIDGAATQVCSLPQDGGEVEALTSSPSTKLSFDVSSDGNRLLFGQFTEAGFTCAVQELPLGSPVPLLGPDGQPLPCEQPLFAIDAIIGPDPVPQPAPAVPQGPRVALERLTAPPGEPFVLDAFGCPPGSDVIVVILRYNAQGGTELATLRFAADDAGHARGEVPTTGFPEGRHVALAVRCDGSVVRTNRTVRVASTPAPLTDDAAAELAAARLAEILYLPPDLQAPRQGDEGVVPQPTHAVLGRVDGFADSLAGAPLAATGPLLYTATDALPAVTRDALLRVLAPGATVYLLGGTSAIGAGVDAELTGLGFAVVRLAGATRIETALAVADEVRRLHPEVEHALVARAFGAEGNPTSAWADAVPAGAYAAAAGVPIVLSGSDALHEATAAWLAADAPTGVTLLGGDAALSTAVVDAIPGAFRVAGTDRAATASAVAAELWDVQPGDITAYLLFDGFREDGWAFGLAAAPISRHMRAPLLMVNGPDVPPATAARLCGPDHTDLYTVSIDPAARTALGEIAGAPCPV